MKANHRFGLTLLLVVVGCNRPDNELFVDGSASSPVAGDGDVAGKASIATAGSGSDASGNGATGMGGTSTDSGAMGGMPAAAGTAPSGGNSDAKPPDSNGVAGQNDGASGTGEPTQPPDPICGNGVIEMGEQCDDAGHAGQDGCSDDCRVVCSQHGGGTLESEDHHCYNGYDAAPFEGAVQACEQRGAHLATIASAEENKLARMLVNDSKWIGGREDVAQNAEGSGTYVWITDEPFTFTNWAKNEPNQLEYRCGNGPGTRCFEHCIAIMGDGSWADRRCDQTDGYVCEWDPPRAAK